MPRLTGRGTGALPAFLLLYAALYGGWGVLSPFLPAVLAERGATAEEIGLLLAAGIGARLVSMPVAGALADRSGAPRAVLAVLLAAGAVLGLGYGAVPAGSASLLLLVGFAQHAATGPLGPLPDALAVRAAAGGARGGRFDYGKVRGAGAAAFIAGAALAGRAVEAAGTSLVVLWLNAGLFVAAAATLILLPGPVPDGAGPPLRPEAEVGGRRRPMPSRPAPEDGVAVASRPPGVVDGEGTRPLPSRPAPEDGEAEPSHRLAFRPVPEEGGAVASRPPGVVDGGRPRSSRPVPEDGEEGSSRPFGLEGAERARAPLARPALESGEAGPARRSRMEGGGPMRALLAIPAFRRLLVVSALISGSHAFYTAFGTLRWQAAGLGADAIGLLWAVAVAAEVAVFFVLGRPLLARLGPGGLCALAAGAGALRWSVMAATASLPAMFLVQPLHGLTFAAQHLAAMAVIARAVPGRLAATAQSTYAFLGTGAAAAVLTFASGSLYERLGAGGYWAMALLCAAAVPAAAALRADAGSGR